MCLHSTNCNCDTNCNTKIIMETHVIKVGTSLGVIIPKHVATEGGFTVGTTLSVNYKNDRIVLSKKSLIRAGWAEAFAAYASEGEDEMLLPDFLDSESIELL